MYNLTITANAGALTDQIQQVVDKQLPFAMSKGLNTMVTKIRDNEVRHEYKKHFELRNESFFKNLSHKVFGSSKRQIDRFGFLTASIQRAELPPPAGAFGRSLSVDTSFMELHVTGGTRKPLRSKLAVPMTVGGANIRRAKRTGKITKSKQPKVLYPKDNTFVAQSQRTGKSILFQRQSRKKLIPMYHFEASVKNTRKYNPVLAVKRGVEARSQFEMRAAMIRAIKTARFFR